MTLGSNVHVITTICRNNLPKRRLKFNVESEGQRFKSLILCPFLIPLKDVQGLYSHHQDDVENEPTATTNVKITVNLI